MNKYLPNIIFCLFIIMVVLIIIGMVWSMKERSKQQAYCEKHGMGFVDGSHSPSFCVSSTGQSFEYHIFRKSNGD